MNFSKNFVWGTSTASYQIEGAHNIGGKGPSIWDTFTHGGGKIKGDTNGDIACDHYNRFEDDLDLLKELGTTAYRFSLSWPRIIPTGIGNVNIEGINFYKKLLQGLINRGITPFVTLYHWDLPQALQDKGGWQNRDIVEWFKEYTSVVMEHLGEYIDYYMVINEFSVVCYVGHYEGVHAPGIKSKDAYLAATHNINLCHGESLRIIKKHKPSAKVGSTLPVFPIRPSDESDESLNASKLMQALWIGNYLDPMYKGVYPEITKDMFSDLIKEGDMEIISSPVDFLGFQHYSPDYARADSTDAFGAILDFAHNSTVGEGDDKVTDLGWVIEPDALYESLMYVKNSYNNPTIYITEGGCAYNNEPSEDGKVHDIKRIIYYQKYLAAAERAYNDGLDIRGYFAWSFLDNFEWADGYYGRFGLVHVDFKTLKRTPKDSFYWYKDLVKDYKKL